MNFNYIYSDILKGYVKSCEYRIDRLTFRKEAEQNYSENLTNWYLFL